MSEVKITHAKMETTVLVSLSALFTFTTFSRPPWIKSLKMWPPSRGTAGRQLKSPA